MSKPLLAYSVTDEDLYEVAQRDGTKLEKGITLTPEYLTEIEKPLSSTMSFFSAYPDLFLDLISPSDDNFNLFFYQRILLRALMRFKEIYWTACRATSKTFLSLLSLFLQCVFIPGTRRFIVAPHKNQAAKVAKEKILEIYERWPLLIKEVVGGHITNEPGNFGKDYVTLKFRNGSQLDVVGGDGTRGLRRHGGLLDELRDADEVEITEVVLPLMNVSRRLPSGVVNQAEPNAQQIVMTSAGVKTSFAYTKLIDMFENSIIYPNASFVVGTDYRIPIKHGLLDRTYVNKLKSSPSFNEDSFGREYMSLWSGASNDSWFNFDKINKYRRLKNPEKRAINREGQKIFYLISVDVGRISDQTAVSVFRCIPKNNKIYSALVNLMVLGLTPESKQFSVQARDLKQIIELYDPIEVVIDTNGLGVGLADEMIRTHIAEDGHTLPAYGFINDDKYIKIQPTNCRKILYGIKANAALNSQIFSNTYTRINNGLCAFLIKEQEAKSLLLGTKTGQRMSLEQRMIRLRPHKLTTSLFNEIANLRLKKTSSADTISLERINARYPKDKFSSLSYGLWRIKEKEEQDYKVSHRQKGSRNFIFFTQGD